MTKIKLGRHRVSPEGISSILNYDIPSELKLYISGVQMVCELLNQTKQVFIEAIISDEQEGEHSGYSINGSKCNLFHLRIEDGNHSKEVGIEIDENYPQVKGLSPVVHVEGFTVALSPQTIVKRKPTRCTISVQTEDYERVLQAEINGISDMVLRGIVDTLDRKIFIRHITSGDQHLLELAESITGFYDGNKLVKDMMFPISIDHTNLFATSISEKGRAKVVPLSDEFKLIRNEKVELTIPRDKVDDNLITPLLNNEKEYKGSLAIVEVPDGTYLLAGGISTMKSKIYVQPLSIKQKISKPIPES